MSIHKKQMVWLVVITAVLLTFSLVAAGGELLPRSLVSSGGGMVSQGNVALHSAIGQPVVGVVQNGATLCSGFLCGADAPPINDPDFYIYLPVTIR
jgi:hypothetical protein